MTQACALPALYLAFALWYAADAARLPARWARPTSRGGHALRAFLRLGGCSIAALGVWQAARAQEPSAALLVSLAGLCVIGTSFVLLAPLCPRLTWGLAIACAAAIACATILECSHG